MDSSSLQILISMVLYMACVIGIGLFFAKRANQNSENYFIGGRSLGPWVAAMSAEASDMSGWLLMGLPGLAYWCGIADAAWTAIGLALGTYINWLIVAKPLRRYSYIAGNAITIPDFFSNRFKEDKKVNSISAKERKKLVEVIKNLKFAVKGFCAHDSAIITAGGVDVKEINPNTMESKLVENLYFCGEMTDVDALTGGFNMQIAFSTGFLAGKLKGVKS